MFFAHFLYKRDGPLAKIWLASHIMLRLKKQDITSIDITAGAREVMAGGGGEKRLALRLCGQLLLGLVKIYQRKVDLAVEEANTIQGRLNKSQDESAPLVRGRRSEKKIDLDENDMKARDNQITLIDKEVDMIDIDDLGAGLNPNGSIDNLIGMEFGGDDMDLGQPHGTYNHATGFIELTNPSGGDATSMQIDPDHIDIDQQEIGIDNDFPMGGEEDVSRIEQGRHVSVNEANGDAGLDVTDVSLGRHTAKELELNNNFTQDGGEFGGGGLFGDDELMLAPDSRPASIAQSDLDEQIAQKKAQLQQVRKVAKLKRKMTAYQAQMDDAPNIDGQEYRRWISDAADLTRSPQERGTPRTTTARAHLETLSQAEDVAASQCDHGASAASRRLFDLPSAGLGQVSLEQLASLTRAAVRNSEIGRLAPQLLQYLQERYTTDVQIAGLIDQLAQEEVEGQQEKDDNIQMHDEYESKSHSGINPDIGGISLGWDNGGDPFGDGGGLDVDEPQLESQQANQQTEEMMIDAPEDFPQPIESDTLYDDAHRDRLDDDERQRHSNTLCADFWNEKQEKMLQTTSIQSGWTKRTLKIHAMLKDVFTKQRSQQIDYSKWISGQPDTVAASTFYQLLILASGGYIQVQQKEINGTIQLSKTSTFDGKKPKVIDESANTSQSNSNSNNSIQMSMSEEY